MAVREIALSVPEAFSVKKSSNVQSCCICIRNYRNNPELNPAEFFEADLFI